LAKDLLETPTWGYLKGSFELIYERLNSRSDHFMPSALLRSQFATLEVPEYALELDIANRVEVLVEQLVDVVA